jgi:hypothetical protein
MTVGNGDKGRSQRMGWGCIWKRGGEREISAQGAQNARLRGANETCGG